MVRKPLRVVVVGAGISGLTASIYLARNGHKVLLLEKNSVCGGLVNSFERERFVFDGGVPALLNSGIIKPMINEIGADIEFIENKVSIGIENEIMHVNDQNSVFEYTRLLKKLYPDSAEEINWFLETVKATISKTKLLYEVDNPLFVDIKRELKNYLPWLLKLPKVNATMKKLQIPIEKHLGRYIKNQSLIDIITQHFFKNTPTFFALSYFYAYTDYIYPKGGIGKLANSLENKARELGVEINLNTKVEKVFVKEHIVEDSNGNRYRYDKLVWSADLKQLYSSAYNIDKNFEENFLKEKTKILSGKPSESVFKIFIAVDEPKEFFSKISAGHFFYTPNREGLGELNKSALEKVKNDLRKEEVFQWFNLFAERNSYEISIPSLRDANLSPEGKTGLIVNFLFDYELTKKISQAGWYDEFKEYVENRVIDVLNDTIYPGIKNKILFKFSSTPITISQYVGTSNGAIVGWAFGENLPIKNSLTKSSLTSLKDVYKAGQWSYQPAGVPTAILTGKLVSMKIK